MKREIKFKAKRLDNGEWCEGYFYEENGNTYIIENRQKESMLNRNVTHHIDPSTVCQFTGLKDCENKDIYEGDIMAEKEYPEFEVGYINCTFAAAYVGDDKFIFNLTALSEVCTVCGNKFDKERMERQITISIEEYNKLIDMHTKREELPEKIEVKKFTSKWWKGLKRASYSLFHYNKNVEQQKLIKRCINEAASTIRENLINGYWRGDLSDYFKDGNFDVSLKHYKDTSYYNVMQWLDKKK